MINNSRSDFCTNTELQRKLKEIDRYCRCEGRSNNPQFCCMFENVYPELSCYLKEMENKYGCEASPPVTPPENATYKVDMLPLGFANKSYNTCVRAGDFYFRTYTDGVTINMKPGLVGYYAFPVGKIISLKFSAHVFYGLMSECIPNEYEFFVALYSAPLSSSTFTIIPETKISFKKVIVPPFTDVSSVIELSDLQIPVNPNLNYVFASHISSKYDDDLLKCNSKVQFDGECVFHRV